MTDDPRIGSAMASLTPMALRTEPRRTDDQGLMTED
jgi:hypothetical protein